MKLSELQLKALETVCACCAMSGRQKKAKDAWAWLQSQQRAEIWAILKGGPGEIEVDKESFVRPNGLYDVCVAYRAYRARGNDRDWSELSRWIEDPSLAIHMPPAPMGPTIGKLVMVIVVLSLIIAPFYFLITWVSGSMDTSSDYQRANSGFDFDGCIKRAVSSCESACETDPVTAYCGIMTAGNVVGSGCTRDMKPLKYGEQVEKCKTKACEKMRTQAWEHCYNQMK